MKIPKVALPHRIEFRTPVNGTYGVGWSDWTKVPRAYIEDKVQIVRNAKGEQVTSSSFVICDPGFVVPPDSQVTVWIGMPNVRTATVIAVARFAHSSAPSHQVLYLE